MTPLAVSGVELTQTGLSGLALGSLYGLIALGFVIVYKATRVINLAQGGTALLGAYLTFWLHVQAGLPYILAVVVAVLLCAAQAAAVERWLIEPVLSRDIHASLMVTMGILIAVQALVAGVWGTDQRNPDDPWRLGKVSLGGLSMTTRDLWVIGLAALAVVGFFLFFRFTLVGTAMRATAFHRVAASAQGIDSRRIGMLAWAIAGGLGGLAGILLGTTVGGGLQPGIANAALVALSAIIVGGLDSPGGAVLGGVIIGLAQQFAASYAPISLGQDVSTVLPYVVMVAILVFLPTGLRGTAEIRRI
ncbi:branched-chain amino acid ABC transporter permease [Dactylosporangium sp. CA-092794]|uniref:branched-chain amino acid ABC transporter permease n=1 Tax=Dactylosporangium sp. CA-092794 TaxID=3239929 RepID=UPI003D8C7134